MTMVARKSRMGMRIVLVLSLLVSLASLQYALVPFGVRIFTGPEIASVIAHVPWQALTHMTVAPIALAAGPFALSAQLRARRPSWHRVIGRVYVVACLIAGIAALATAPFASGGPVAGWGFGILAVLWIASTAKAWSAAMARDFVLHKRMMIYSFALTFGAVTLRLQMALGMIFLHLTYGQMSPWLAWSSWIPNLLAVALYELHRATPSRSSRAPRVVTAS